MHVGKAARQIARDKGLNRAELARACGWSHPQRWTTLTSNEVWRTSTVELVADALGVRPDELIALACELDDQRRQQNP